MMTATEYVEKFSLETAKELFPFYFSKSWEGWVPRNVEDLAKTIRGLAKSFERDKDCTMCSTGGVVLEKDEAGYFTVAFTCTAKSSFQVEDE